MNETSHNSYVRRMTEMGRGKMTWLTLSDWRSRMGREGRRVSRDGEVPSQKELSSYFEELFSSKVPRQKELSSSNKELFSR